MPIVYRPSDAYLKDDPIDKNEVLGDSEEIFGYSEDAVDLTILLGEPIPQVRGAQGKKSSQIERSAEERAVWIKRGGKM